MSRIIQFSIFLLLLFFSCKKDEFNGIGQFQVTVQGMDPITFYNPECGWGNYDMNQGDYSGGMGAGIYEYGTSYWNDYSPDSILNEFFIALSFLGTDNSLDRIAQVLNGEHDSNENEHFFIHIQLELNGIRYTNKLQDHDPNTPGWETNDSCYYRINYFDVDYHSDCLDENLIALNLDFHGKLYTWDSITIKDSIEIRGDQLNLLFD